MHSRRRSACLHHLASSPVTSNPTRAKPNSSTSGRTWISPRMLRKAPCRPIPQRCSNHRDTRRGQTDRCGDVAVGGRKTSSHGDASVPGIPIGVPRTTCRAAEAGGSEAAAARGPRGGGRAGRSRWPERGLFRIVHKTQTSASRLLKAALSHCRTNRHTSEDLRWRRAAELDRESSVEQCRLGARRERADQPR
jgi:hypothetical protein